jgi:ubiquinone/menaquinone biosynthesis C-methylase UbiE
MTKLKIVALYPSNKVASQARERIRTTKFANRITCEVGKIQALPFEESSFDLIAGVGPVLIREKSKETAMREMYRVLRPGGVALVGGRYLGMPTSMRVSTQLLRQSAADSGVAGIRVYDDMGQWVEIRKGIKGGGNGD